MRRLRLGVRRADQQLGGAQTMNTLHARPAAAGFTLLELMITLAISTVLMLLATPVYTQWVQGAKVKTTAESVHIALSRTRVEAVRRNAPVTLSILPQPGAGASWSMSAAASNLTDSAAGVSLADAATGSTGNTVPVNVLASNDINTAATAPAAGAAASPIDITFTGLGRVSNATATRRIEFVSALSGVDKRYAILLSPAGAPRLCNPALTRAQSVQGCL